MTWIQTYTGKQFWPLAPQEDDIDIRDIAHALSLLCRYNGHCTEFFSVAQHSVMVSMMVPKCDALLGLLHDAAEAYISDVVRPIKPHTNVGPIEARIMQAIVNKFSLPPRPPSIQSADLCCLERERRQLMTEPPAEWSTADAWDGNDTIIDPWPWRKAEEMFLSRFLELVKEED